jgi:hypothetical protein
LFIKGHPKYSAIVQPPLVVKLPFNAAPKIPDGCVPYSMEVVIHDVLLEAGFHEFVLVGLGVGCGGLCGEDF